LGGFNAETPQLMKQNHLLVLKLAVTLLTAGIAFGQAPANSTAAAKPQKLVRIATLNTVQANREFQNNVQLLQNQRAAAVELTAAVEKEKDAKKKKELKTQLDALLAKLNENNNAMQKAYGFSLSRSYTMEIETAHIYMLVTDEEAAKIEQAQKTKK
jgi:hypothetical protein